MENENEQVQEEVVEQEEVTTTEESTEQEETQEDVLTLTGEEKAEFEKWKAKKEERRQFAERAKSSPPQKTVLNISPERLERLELSVKGYTEDEIEQIMELGGQKALKNPIVKTAIDNMRAKAKSKESNQALNSKSPVFQKFTQEDLKKMSSAELAKILPRD